MSEESNPQDSISIAWVIGLLAAVGGGLLLMVGLDDDNAMMTTLGWVISGVGSLALSVAVVATGVKLGVRAGR